MPDPARRAIAALLTVAVLTVGCSASGGASPSADASATPDRRSPDGSAVAPSLPAGVNVPADVLAAVVADAAARAGVAPDEVAPIEGAAVRWNNGALGCPQPGMSYTQAEVSGWRVVVEAGGQRIDYRITGPDRFVICEGLPGT